MVLLGGLEVFWLLAGRSAEDFAGVAFFLESTVFTSVKRLQSF